MIKFNDRLVPGKRGVSAGKVKPGTLPYHAASAVTPHQERTMQLKGSARIAPAHHDSFMIFRKIGDLPSAFHHNAHLQRPLAKHFFESLLPHPAQSSLRFTLARLIDEKQSCEMAANLLPGGWVGCYAARFHHRCHRIGHDAFLCFNSRPHAATVQGFSAEYTNRAGLDRLIGLG